ncbi:Vma12 domain-containing protein [Cephalotus follicularis]|uniref:Vma12 domain-containing protein n=1 Tax=Cephalotus follicularis TaxID=3775 RepID=A0A1Q3DBU7_CEPFO|nr:Vma12 domain-containing protein [Cephalotus follicularis]
MSTNNPQNPVGLVVSATETIRSFLLAASKDQNLSKELQEIASNLSSKPNVPYKMVREIWVGSHSSNRPKLICLFRGIDFSFTSPKPREKIEELKVRLRNLAEIAERNDYEELVKDIAPRKGTSEPFSSYKDQLGFGLHVIVTMFSGYLVGYAAFRALFKHSPIMNAAGGILGLVCTMLVETLLFIIRTSSQDLRSSSSNNTLKKNQ